jgi:hypothetical protein
LLPDLILDRIQAIDQYVGRHGLVSYDPYDGLLSPFSEVFRTRNQLLARIWQQSIRLIPWNVRRLLGIKRMIHTKAVSDFASAYARLYAMSHKEDYRDKANTYLELLLSIRSKTTSGIGWGLRFPFATRFVSANADQANIFQTINAIHALLDGVEFLHDKKWLAISEEAMRFLQLELGVKDYGTSMSWNYWQNFDVVIYNVSGLMIGVCARMWQNTGKEEYRTMAVKLYEFVRQGQNSDGSWYYSADPRGQFIDGFHTGYVLEGIMRAVGLKVLEMDINIVRGIEFYLRNFFTADGTPRYYSNQTFPIDGQNAAQALQTLCFILNVNFAAGQQLNLVFKRIDELLWNRKGYYNYKKTKWITYRTPMHRWVTGPMFLALTYLQSHYKPRHHSYE